ncbi:MAG: penicillin-binding protein 1C [Paludibacteraceae bacterium]|nr:penicillin-binding protein 1C [Paludibacteraceae bacterium]
MWISTPKMLFSSEYSTLLYASDGTLMNAHIASDGQWRFPPSDSIPNKFRTAVINYEDRWFYYHLGVNPISVAKAAIANHKKGFIVRGGSTITMQLSRISSGKNERTYWRKFVELNRALYIELLYSKDEILNMYASHAPMGGNVVGIEAASWRYFGRSSENLTWAESSMLAVLPNAPSLIHISKNRDLLLNKRNSLLKKLYNRGYIDSDDYNLAIAEPLPDTPEPLPSMAPHLASTMLKTHKGEAIYTSLDPKLQNPLQNLANHYAMEYTAKNNVHNIAILVQEVRSGDIKAYIGNASYKADERFCNNVDIINSQRSTGSILKPILYAAMLSEGIILPKTLITDTPLYMNGFSPQNFNKTFSGVVPADEAIIRSLNVPLVRMLKEYGIERFLTLLRSLGITTMDKNADHYGASLILGGAEAKLIEICELYRKLSSGVQEFRSSGVSGISKAGIYYMLEAMSKLNRPEEEADWQQFDSMKRIAWKTGTSYGGKDAWAVGMTPDYVVGVWVGNATGEGRAGITGVGYAAPVLFQVFSRLPSSGWFEPPYSDMVDEAVCRISGYKAGIYCTEVDTIPIPDNGTNTKVCPFHKQVHLSKDRAYRVNSSCYNVNDIVNESWFVLSPTQEYFYRQVHTNHKTLPPYMPGCENYSNSPIDIIYPTDRATVFLPKDFNGKVQSIVCQATHINSNATLYWHLDDEYAGSTQTIHNMAMKPSKGRHLITVVDEEGNAKAISINFIPSNSSESGGREF